MTMRDGLMKLRCSEMSINRNEYKYICPNQKDKLGVQIMEIIFQTRFSVLTSCKCKSKEQE